MTTTDKVLFYYDPISRAQVIHRMLEEACAEYEIKFTLLKNNDQKSPEYLKINPMGKLPTIIHKGVVVTEVAAICLYLADAFPEANLAPKIDDPKRGEYYRWMMFSINCVEQAVMDRNFPRKDKMNESGLGYGSYENMLNVLEKAVSQDYLIGKQFTAADVYLSSYLSWFFFQKIMPETEVLKSYVARCMDRPAVRRYEDKVKQLTS